MMIQKTLTRLMILMIKGEFYNVVYMYYEVYSARIINYTHYFIIV